jgi:hypothetical protein
LGVSPFKANYGFNPIFGEVPVADQCLPLVEQRLNQIHKVQEELKVCLEDAKEAMSGNFDKQVRHTPNWHIGNKVWLSSQNIPTTRPSPKLGHWWLGPFPILAKVSQLVYKLALPESMARIHPVLHVLVLRKRKTDTIEGQQQDRPEPITLDDKEEWEVAEVLDCRKRGKWKEYFVSWKGFGPEQNLWEPEANLNNVSKALQHFNQKYPDAASRHKRRKQM